MADEDELIFNDIGGETADSIDFESIRFSCFGVKLTEEKILFTSNNKVVLEVPKNHFPKEMNLNDVETISTLLKTIREHGLNELVNQLNLQSLS